MTDSLHTLLVDETRTTLQVLKTAACSLHNNALTFFLLSLLILSFRTVVENGTHHLTSFIDNDPSLKSLLSRIEPHANPNGPGIEPAIGPGMRAHNRRNRRPFLQLTRVNDDFFSADDNDLFRNRHNGNGNASFLVLYPKFGFSGPVFDYGVRVKEVFGKPGFGFKVVEETSEERGKIGNGESEESEEILSLDNKGVDFEFFVNFGRRDAVALVFLVTFLSGAYGWVVIGFLATYGCVLGVVFVGVVNDLVGRFGSFFGLVWDGGKLGMKRLPGFILMRWAVRDALTQLLGLWYFSEIEDQYSFFKLFVRLKLMPFSIMAPWIRGFEKEVSGFLFTWFMVDTFVAFVFAVGAWVAIVDTRRTGRDIVKEGCYLLSMMMNQAVQLKCLEAICCGSFVRWALAGVCGKSFAAVFQSAAEVYFMAAWLVFYLAARCKDATLQGQRFGQREVEGFVEGLR